jgi:hypothetical protein
MILIMFMLLMMIVNDAPDIDDETEVNDMNNVI